MTQYNVSWVWLNAKQTENKSSTFEWVDGTDFDYSNWYVGEPNQVQKDYPLCIDMYKNGQCCKL
ncbi:hypothetical protein B4U80_00997 [Leptotrombidium deliense]|uniref:C-type lectin domain-containing protein n=1 Tax=Leptotrombidium deliense TaxID=299467 RepID=A0A443S1L5_9ACAR|nr:hypothetical protein B4U80_00997 [Leptotrombidium deliense]